MKETAYYLAIDMGASGGRHILGHQEEGRLILEEVHRFSNVPVRKGRSLYWDEDRLYAEIVRGIKKCGELQKIPLSIGIDTWGVDYALLDKTGALLGGLYSYRDARAEAFMETSVPFEELFAVSGIAIHHFNTVYQLLADKASGRLKRAAHFLMLPEYFSQRLTGRITGKTRSEYTAASTTGLLDAKKRAWHMGVIQALGLPSELFAPVAEPPYSAGRLDKIIQETAGFDAEVLLIASHDTASAVAAAAEDSLYISSGTWSLLGIQGEPILTAAARDAGYTNEGALNGRVRFLKNIMGLWVLQQIRGELNGYSFAELESLARETEPEAAGWFIDINLPRFLNPPSMIEAVQDECRRTGQKTPKTPGELALCVYLSLARSYKNAIDDLEQITGNIYPSISIIGGGSKDRYLNSLTARHTGKPVSAGPTEASAAGNLLLQMRHAGELAAEKSFAELACG